jgi:hypothetical protein
MGILNNVAAQWAVRRVFDYGGWIGTFAGGLFLFYNGLTPSQQGLINGLLQGNWQDITLGSLLPFMVLVYSQIISYRATVKPQAVVEENGNLVTNTLAPKKEKEVAEVVTNVSSRKSLWDILKGQ